MWTHAVVLMLVARVAIGCIQVLIGNTLKLRTEGKLLGQGMRALGAWLFGGVVHRHGH